MSVFDVFLEHLVPVSLLDDLLFLAVGQRLAQNTGLEMEIGHFAVIARGKQNVSVKAPAEICDAHHAEVHHQSEWLLQLRLPDGDRRIL